MIIDDKRGRCLKNVELSPLDTVIRTSSIGAELTKSYLNKLITNVSDKMMSSLFVIKSYTQLLKKHRNNNEFFDRSLVRMGASSLRMERAITELLSLVNIYVQDPPEKELVYFRESYDKALLNVHDLLMNKSHIKLQADFSESTKVWFDKPFLELIFTELLSNAIQHNTLSKDVTIKIKSYKLLSSYVLQIEDNGVGFDIGSLKEGVKDPFNIQSSLDHSLGTGLSKVEAIAKVCNMVFEIDSVPDQGTVCRFYFR
jgi:signal transduction histidine kinase